MTQAIWTQTYPVNTLVVNPQKRLGLVGLLGILQDVAWMHADHLGHGYEATIDAGALWVLSRQKLVMADWPRWRDQLTVRTWVRPIKGPMFLRDYEMLIGERKVGECTAGWFTLDAKTRRPVRLAAAGQRFAWREEGALATTPGKIASLADLAQLASFSVRNSDLDLNGHVNNTRYAQWILDAAPNEAHRDCRVAAYEVNFLAEIQVGDAVAIEGAPFEPPPSPEIDRHFQGRRLSDGAIAFAALIRAAEA